MTHTAVEPDARRSYKPIPRNELFAGLPRSLPAREMLADVKGGPLTLMYGALFRRFGIVPRGVIHLGANVGQEALAYLTLGYERALFVEPEPTVFAQLTRHLAYVDKLAGVIGRFVGLDAGRWSQAFQVAVGNSIGSVKLFVQPKSSQANSILAPIPGSMGNILQAPVAEVDVPLTTVDQLMLELADGWQMSDFNVLYVNVEGAELMALQGAKDTLAHMEFAFIEVNLEAHYEGEPSDDAIERHMRSAGFELRWTCGGMVPDTGYMVFTRA